MVRSLDMVVERSDTAWRVRYRDEASWVEAPSWYEAYWSCVRRRAQNGSSGGPSSASDLY